MADFLQTVRERVVVYDGAMGTNIQLRNPSLDDYWGKENCSEVLVLSRPDIIKDIHSAFFQVGCDVVETNTFGGTSVVLGEFDLKDRTAEINIAAAKLAKEVASQFRRKTSRDSWLDPWGRRRSCRHWGISASTRWRPRMSSKPRL